MGLILTRFRSKKTTIQTLETLDTKIKSIEQDSQGRELTLKRVMSHVMAYSVGLYVIIAVLYYYMYVGRSEPLLYSLMYASPLLILPVLVIFLRSSLSGYYNWTINRNRKKLTELKEQKKKILEDVMNTETYKVAKEILDKFGSPEEQSKSLMPFQPTLDVPGNSPRVSPATPGQWRQRQLALNSSTSIRTLNVNAVPPNNATPSRALLRSDQLPRPLLGNNRSAFDKVVDFLLKDGPNYRMALICTACSKHNGMAMMEEYEYFSYECAYCGCSNPARKQRPAAPLLDLRPRPAYRDGAVDDTSSMNSSNESEDEIEQNNTTAKLASSPSYAEEEPKSEQEKKED